LGHFNNLPADLQNGNVLRVSFTDERLSLQKDANTCDILMHSQRNTMIQNTVEKCNRCPSRRVVLCP